MWARADQLPSILLLAGSAETRTLCQHLALVPTGPLGMANSPDEADAHLARYAWDIFLIDGHFPGMARPFPAPPLDGSPIVVLLDDAPPELLEVTPDTGLVWLPRRLALDHASVFLAGLEQALTLASLSKRLARTEGHLRESQTQLETMLRLLGSSSEGAGPRWHSQRAMLERLTEEVARVDRHGGTFSVIVAEATHAGPHPEGLVRLAEQVARRKRGSDVIGQYGPQGFMLLLPQTPPEGARTCCSRLTNLLAAADTGTGWRLDFGVGSYQQPHTSAPSILRLAEEELERARLGSVV